MVLQVFLWVNIHPFRTRMFAPAKVLSSASTVSLSTSTVKQQPQAITEVVRASIPIYMRTLFWLIFPTRESARRGRRYFSVCRWRRRTVFPRALRKIDRSLLRYLLV